MRVVIAGGGTAGHVNPALALAHALGGHAVTFAGTNGGAESRLVPGAGFPLELIQVRGFDRSKPISLLSTGVQALRATRQAGSLLQRVRAEVVVGMGGYVSLPVCVAARQRLATTHLLSETGRGSPARRAARTKHRPRARAPRV